MIVVTPQILVFSLVALVVPSLVVVIERVVAEAVFSCMADIEAASAFAQARALGAARGQSPRAGPLCGVGFPRSPGWWARAHCDFLAPVGICASRLRMVVCAWLLEFQLLSQLAGLFGRLASFSAVAVAGTGGA